MYSLALASEITSDRLDLSAMKVSRQFEQLNLRSLGHSLTVLWIPKMNHLDSRVQNSWPRLNLFLQTLAQLAKGLPYDCIFDASTLMHPLDQML